MKAQATAALVAGLLAYTTAAQSTLALGELTFAAPQCSDGGSGVNVSDCSTAISQLLAANCTGGVCRIPAAAPDSAESTISQLVGKCEVAIGAFANGDAVTFNQDSVETAFPAFINECFGHTGGFGAPLQLTTDGILRLIFFNGIIGGGG
ncbi:hypothetical protein FP744_10005791 [Trichoderma asperellum]|nr:hypothetical protein LI328DRAFT_168223 [Trichoderma asperelloides]